MTIIAPHIELNKNELEALRSRKFVENTREGITASVYYQSGWMDCHKYFESLITQYEDKYDIGLDML